MKCIGYDLSHLKKEQFDEGTFAALDYDLPILQKSADILRVQRKKDKETFFVQLS